MNPSRPNNKDDDDERRLPDLFVHVVKDPGMIVNANDVEGDDTRRVHEEEQGAAD